MKNLDCLIKNTEGFYIKIHGDIESITESIREKLKSYNAPLFFNDLSSRYFIFDFKIEGIWFSANEFTEQENIAMFYQHTQPLILNAYDVSKCKRD